MILHDTEKQAIEISNTVEKCPLSPFHHDGRVIEVIIVDLHDLASDPTLAPSDLTVK